MLNAFIERTLAERSLARACPVCGTRLKANHRFRVCDSCYAGRVEERQGERQGDRRGRRPDGARGPDRGAAPAEGGHPQFHHPLPGRKRGKGGAGHRGRRPAGG